MPVRWAGEGGFTLFKGFYDAAVRLLGWLLVFISESRKDGGLETNLLRDSVI